MVGIQHEIVSIAEIRTVVQETPVVCSRCEGICCGSRCCHSRCGYNWYCGCGSCRRCGSRFCCRGCRSRWFRCGSCWFCRRCSSRFRCRGCRRRWFRCSSCWFCRRCGGWFCCRCGGRGHRCSDRCCDWLRFVVNRNIRRNCRTTRNLTPL